MKSSNSNTTTKDAVNTESDPPKDGDKDVGTEEKYYDKERHWYRGKI